MQQLLDSVHQDFITHVAKQRNMSYNEAKELATGEIFLGKDAKELGLVDDWQKVGKAAYDGYIRNGLMTQLIRINLGDDIEEDHMVNRQWVSAWAFEQGQKDNVITKVVKETNSIEISQISPNPAADVFEVQFNSLIESFAVIEIVNSAGQVALKTDEFLVHIGTNTVTLNINYLAPGNYTVYIKTEGEFTSKVIIISR